MRSGAAAAVLAVTLALSACAVSSPVPVPTPMSPSTGVGASSPDAAATNEATLSPSPSPSPSRPVTPLSAVGIGDSVMAGTHCDCPGPMAAYADLLARATGREVTPRGFGVNGATTSTVLTQLASDPVRAAVARADVVVVIIGANDLAADERQFASGSCDAACYTPDVAAMGARLGRLLDRVASLTAGHHPPILVTGYWDLFAEAGLVRSGPDSDRLHWQEAITDAANAEIAHQARLRGDVYVDLVTPFRGPGGTDDPTGLLAGDGDHPNAAGVRALAKALVAAHPVIR